MRHAFTIALIAGIAISLGTARTVHAQTEGWISAGASVTVVSTADDDVDSAVGVGPLVRLNPKRGWGPAGALNWFRADLQSPEGTEPFARLRVRHLMAGIAYTAGTDRALTSFSVVAGPSFNSIDFRDAYLESLTPGTLAPDIDVDTSFAIRPGVGVTLTLAPRVAFVGFGGYLINRPDVTFRDQFGRETSGRWKADSVVLSAGVVYSFF